MSKRQELIDELKENIGCGIEIALYDEEIKMCIEALEKQVSKKPRINRVSDGTEYMKCPQCRLTTVLYSDMRPDYCSKCGQKLDYRLE